jgi:hypothetical protein
MLVSADSEGSYLIHDYTNSSESLGPCSTGRCMELFQFKPVSLSFVDFGCPTEIRIEVYSYNFRDDKRLVKLLCRHRQCAVSLRCQTSSSKHIYGFSQEMVLGTVYQFVMIVQELGEKIHQSDHIRDVGIPGTGGPGKSRT